ncbi:unnamed protein product [marine sediment metagenome]|uniref:Uncharacterized protein n=1 Tax=marine sediment metagenome TaxID=412755 RepID=X0T4Y0_9ZZZZ
MKTKAYDKCSKKELCTIAKNLNEIIIELKIQNNLLKQRLAQYEDVDYLEKHKKTQIYHYVDDTVIVNKPDPFEKIDRELDEIYNNISAIDENEEIIINI